MSRGASSAQFSCVQVKCGTDCFALTNACLLLLSQEFEKLISFSGTPTVVWRRTCEIVVVGAEFSMLTQWSKEYLSGRYIYEVSRGGATVHVTPLTILRASSLTSRASWITGNALLFMRLRIRRSRL